MLRFADLEEKERQNRGRVMGWTIRKKKPARARRRIKRFLAEQAMKRRIAEAQALTDLADCAIVRPVESKIVVVSPSQADAIVKGVNVSSKREGP